MKIDAIAIEIDPYGDITAYVITAGRRKVLKVMEFKNKEQQELIVADLAGENLYHECGSTIEQEITEALTQQTQQEEPNDANGNH